eukprot:PhF_6_TR29086/c0_g1_i3/m.42412
MYIEFYQGDVSDGYQNVELDCIPQKYWTLISCRIDIETLSLSYERTSASSEEDMVTLISVDADPEPQSYSVHWVRGVLKPSISPHPSCRTNYRIRSVLGKPNPFVLDRPLNNFGVWEVAVEPQEDRPKWKQIPPAQQMEWHRCPQKAPVHARWFGLQPDDGSEWILKYVLSCHLYDVQTHDILEKLCRPPLSRCLSHVAAYVVTTKGNVLTQGVRAMKGFGGCRHPNTVIRMMNSLRLELMDESSLLTTHPAFLRASKLYIHDDVLCQIFLFDEDILDIKSLYSPESARSAKGGAEFPPDCVLKDINFTKHTHAPPNAKMFQYIALNQSVKWRQCDGKSFAALNALGAFEGLLRGSSATVDDGEDDTDSFLVIAPGSTGAASSHTEELAQLFNVPEMKYFRRFTRMPWVPVLWKCATQHMENWPSMLEWVNLVSKSEMKQMQKQSS